VSTGVEPALDRYAEQHTTEFGPELAELARDAATLGSVWMLSGPVVGRLLELLVHATRARLVLEIGTFAGVSALAMAGGLAPDGRIITCEIDRERAEFARARFAAAGLGERIELRVGPAIETIESLDGPFDLVFIDAWKPDYVDYFEAVLPKLADDGVILADNTLSGLAGNDGIATFNEHVIADQRVECVLVPIRDGVTLIRRRP
jgi:caffeoyl-CoA O-methyltransferase